MEYDVVVVGAGPAGLSAAYQLRKMGYASTIFEERKELGGMMRYGIPGYRTPRDLLDKEIERIINLGDIELVLGKRVGKVATEAQEKSGFLTTYLVELFKNHKLIKIFQKEDYEKNKANKYLHELKEKNQKILTVFVRMSPIMETLTGIMIAFLIFYSGKLMSNGELNINNFFSFLAAMMLAYQPVRALSTLNMVLNQGLSAASRILPIIAIT